VERFRSLPFRGTGRRRGGMGWPGSPRGCFGGGKIIPPLRTLRLRIGFGAAAILIAAVLAGYPLVYAGDLTAAAALLAALGLLFVVVTVISRTRFAVAAGLFALAAEYVLVEASDRVGVVSIIGYAAGLVVLAEILVWLEQLPYPARMDVTVLSRWLQGVGLIGLSAAGLAVIVLAAAGLRIPGAVSGAIAASLAVLLLIAIPWLLIKRPPGRAAGRKQPVGPGGGRSVGT